jgi:hypothetical protein
MYRLISNRSQIENAVAAWREKLTGDPDSMNVALPEHSLWGRLWDRFGPNGEPVTYLNIFRIEADDRRPNAAEINVPANGIDVNVLGAIGEDERGRRWILRQGFLSHNHELGGVGLAEFPRYTNLPEAEVDPAPSNSDRRYYAVACVEDSPLEVRT